MKQTDITLAKLEAAYKRLGYQIFDMDKPFNLNIFGIRAKGGTTNTFNDLIGCFYTDEGGAQIVHAFKGTTDPGQYYMENLLNKQGCAVLTKGQWRGCWKLGKHRDYAALQQVKSVTVYRVPDGKYAPGNPYTTDDGIFGINIHRADDDRIAQFIGKYSAGCQVIQRPEDFNAFIRLCRKSAAKYGPGFSYTLLLEEEVM
jgi:hypothetical protein